MSRQGVAQRLPRLLSLARDPVTISPSWTSTSRWTSASSSSVRSSSYSTTVTKP